MAQVYLAAPFFDPAQTKRLNQVLAALNENESVSGIFSPRDDTNKAGLTENSPAWQRQVFGEDIRGLHQATVMVAILDYIGEDLIREPPLRSAMRMRTTCQLWRYN
ncbi:nucleoside deoxyribosyltransferase [Lacticaseibacillus rhamnosus 2166]|nr:nucleoside deoxyribosyltransferase [Lacticaseibacillus rhamnosus 2166]